MQIAISSDAILKTLNLEPEYLKLSSISRVKRCSYNIAVRWLATYETDSTSSDTERLQGYLQAFLTLCDIGDFERAKALILLPIDNQKPLHEYFGKLGLYIEQCQLYKALLDKFDSRFNCLLLNGLGWASGRLGKTDEALLSHQQELEIAQSLGDLTLEASAYEGLGQIHTWNLEKHKEAIFFYEKMLDIAIKTCNYKQQILALEGRAYSQEMIGENNQAISQYKQALKLAENINDKEITRMLLRGLGAVYVSMGKYKLGINLLKDQLKENNSLKEKRECAVILHNIGLTYMRLNKDQKSIGYIQEALQIAIEIRDAQLQAYCYANLGSIYARMKLFEKSLQYLLKAEKNEESAMNKSIILANIAYCYGCQKQFKLAMNYANKAMDIAKIIDRRPSQGLALAMIANAYWQQGRYFKGLAYLLKSILVHPPWKDADGMLTFVKAIEEISGSLREILRQWISKIKLKN